MQINGCKIQAKTVGLGMREKLALLSPKFGNAENKMISLTLALLTLINEKNDYLLYFRHNLGEHSQESGAAMPKRR